MSTAALLADIRDSDFETAWIYTLFVFFVTCVAGSGVWLAARQLRQMWRNGARLLAVSVGVFAGGAALMFASILATLLVNFVNIASGPGGTP